MGISVQEEKHKASKSNTEGNALFGKVALGAAVQRTNHMDSGADSELAESTEGYPVWVVAGN